MLRCSRDRPRAGATRRGPGAMSGAKRRKDAAARCRWPHGHRPVAAPSATGHGPERRALPPATQKARRLPSKEGVAPRPPLGVGDLSDRGYTDISSVNFCNQAPGCEFVTLTSQGEARLRAQFGKYIVDLSGTYSARLRARDASATEAIESQVLPRNAQEFLRGGVGFAREPRVFLKPCAQQVRAQIAKAIE